MTMFSRWMCHWPWGWNITRCLWKLTWRSKSFNSILHGFHYNVIKSYAKYKFKMRLIKSFISHITIKSLRHFSLCSLDAESKVVLDTIPHLILRARNAWSNLSLVFKDCHSSYKPLTRGHVDWFCSFNLYICM